MSRLLLLGAPEGLSITVDFNSWTTGPLFKGIKDIPAGMHFITSNLDQLFGRSGFFIDGTNPINIWQWDHASNRFIQVLDQDQIDRIHLGLNEIELGLGPYPNSLEHSWELHSSYLSLPLLNKICPANLVDTVTSSSQLSEVADPRLNSTHTIHFTPIDLKHSFPAGTMGALRTKYAMDKSWLLSRLISESSAKELLGELQISFIMFILGQFYDGFDQWKLLIHLICSSEQMLEDDHEFYMQFIKILMIQLKECPEDFFRDILSQDNFLQDALIALASNTAETKVVGQLGDTLNRLWTLIYDRFQWDIQSQVKMTDLQQDNDEYAPVVVE